ncbi:GTP-binding protein [Lentisphaera profundi]|uniref:GTP-binding protein n=1 Tax=Lentisphaera profundi TaxID=1658616 RepID=A0ABY7W0Y4_9BACT|nr:GTP-binding protein [Lentisphaera profundi]WDE99085.1 GTP-binding protein [Lentisphaera profundi]
MRTQDKKIPITILTGFLGAGKTSLLNKLIKSSDKKLALIINEFGELGIDGELVCEAENQILELNNGCLCCTVQGDLTKILLQLYAKKDSFEQIVIETTGLANPAPVAELIYFDPLINSKFYVDGIITVFDTLNAEHVLSSPEGLSQIVYADKVLLSKLDKCDNFDPSQLSEINPLAVYERCDHGELVDLNALLNLGGFNVDNLSSEIKTHLHSHMGSVSLSGEGELNNACFRQWIGSVLFDMSDVVYRMKGIVNLSGVEGSTIFQSVHRLFEDEKAEKDYGNENRVVFIGEGLNEDVLKKGFFTCFKE